MAAKNARAMSSPERKGKLAAAREGTYSARHVAFNGLKSFCLRLNLLLRRHLYNPARAELPRHVLPSDPSEEPFLVLCTFQSAPSFRLTGVVVDLQTFCRTLEASFDQAAWRSPELLVQIRRADSGPQDSSGTGASDAS